MKYLINNIRCVSLFWHLDQNQQKKPDFTPVKDQRQNSSLGDERLLKMATFVIPCLILVLGGQSAQAWEKSSNLGENQELQLESVIPKLTIQPVISHEIQAGDTLWELSEKYETSPEEIAKLNEINAEEILQVGENLYLPSRLDSQVEQPQLVTVPVGGVGGAFSPSEMVLESFSEKSLTTPIPQIIKQKETEFQVREREQAPLPIQQFLADVQQLQASYEEKPLDTINTTPLPLDWNPSDQSNNQGKLFSPIEASSEDAPSTDSVATAPIKVEFYNRFLHPPYGEQVPELPPLSSPDQYLPGSSVFDGYIWPAEGVFTSGYGMRWGRMHRGIDIAGPIGTPILAAAPGEVVVAGWNSGGYGNLVKLKHSDGSLTLYAHNNRILVRKGQEVDQGQQIAEMGNTGRSTGPHLHFEIHPPGRGAVNPMAYLPKR